MEKLIKKYIAEYISDYYPDQQEGEYTGDAEALAAELATQYPELDEEKLENKINEMITAGELETNQYEWVNPENDQRTVYVDIITLPGHEQQDSEWVHVRPSRSSWGGQHESSFESVGVGCKHETFESWRDAAAEELELAMNHSGSDDYPITPTEIRSWKSWDDVSAHDIIR